MNWPLWKPNTSLYLEAEVKQTRETFPVDRRKIEGGWRKVFERLNMVTLVMKIAVISSVFVLFLFLASHPSPVLQVINDSRANYGNL